MMANAQNGEKEDLRILRKYKKGKAIDPVDLRGVERLASMGLIRRGFDTETIVPTAITTELGKSAISSRLFW